MVAVMKMVVGETVDPSAFLYVAASGWGMESAEMHVMLQMVLSPVALFPAAVLSIVPKFAPEVDDAV